MLDAYRDLSEATGGAVNPLVGDSLAALGYDASYSLVASAPVAAPSDWTDRSPHATFAFLRRHTVAFRLLFKHVLSVWKLFMIISREFG